MEELLVTRVWMAGVIAMMIVFGAVAAIGHLKSRKRGSDPRGESDS